MDTKVIHRTKVAVDLEILKAEILKMREAYDKVGTRGTHEGRSLFSSWNVVNKSYERILKGEYPGTVFDGNVAIIPVEGSISGSSLRVYYHPSLTSLAKQFRKAVVPVNKDKVFICMDLKAAEFALFCIFCQEEKALKAYREGKDIYMEFANLFPEGTKREQIKEALIASMYGVTSYTLQKKLGVSEAFADRLLASVQSGLPGMELKKRSVVARAFKTGQYVCPNGFDQETLVKVSDAEGDVLPNMAKSAYVQSALGLLMQKFIKTYESKINGTFLTVFDFVLCEIDESSKDRFIESVTKFWAPLLPGEFKTGKTMYDTMYKDK